MTAPGRGARSPGLACLLLAAVAALATGEGPVGALLEGDLAGWRLVAPVKRFPGAELYGHIDGGAELHLELGFDELAVGKLGSGAARVTAEVYRMADAEAALGVYLARCGRETPRPGLAARHTVGLHQLQLVSGRHYVCLLREGGPGAPEGALEAVAAALAGRLPTAPATRVLDALPAAGRVAGSERVIRGPVGLGALITLGAGDCLELRGQATAVAAGYLASPSSPAHTLVLADYPSDAAAAHALAHLGATLDPEITPLEATPGGLTFRDYSGTFGVARLRGRRLELLLDLPAPPATAAPGR